MAEQAVRTEPDLELEVDPARSIHQHPLDPISLAFGAIFTILGAVFLFGDIDAASLSMAWVWAAASGAVGLLLLAVGLRRHRRNMDSA